MVEKQNLNLLEEEILMEVVRSHPILYDRTQKGYKEKEAVCDAWCKVAESIDFIENAKTAELCFITFKKRYLKKKSALKKADKPGQCTSLLDKAKKNIERYLFFTWFDEYTRPRKSKSNITYERSPEENTSQCGDSDASSEESESYDLPDERNAGIHEDNFNAIPTGEKSEISLKKKCSEKVKTKTNDIEFELIKEMHADIKKRRKDAMNRKEFNDPDVLFCQTIAAEMRQFTPQEKFMVKYDIRELLYKYQMAKYTTTTHNLPQQLVSPDVGFNQEGFNAWHMLPSMTNSVISNNEEGFTQRNQHISQSSNNSPHSTADSSNSEMYEPQQSFDLLAKMFTYQYD